jgi:hypothetical protein
MIQKPLKNCQYQTEPKEMRIFIYGCNSKKKIIISDEKKDYVSSLDFIKYLVIPMESMRIEKVRFVGAKVQKILKEIGRLIINQILKVIRIMILTQMNLFLKDRHKLLTQELED